MHCPSCKCPSLASIPFLFLFLPLLLYFLLKLTCYCKEIQPVHSEGDQPWDFFGRNDANIHTLKIHSGSSYSGSNSLVLAAQSCPTLSNSMDCSLPVSSVCGILQARILEWIAISFSRGSSWSRDWTRVSCIAGRFFYHWATREAMVCLLSN